MISGKDVLEQVDGFTYKIIKSIRHQTPGHWIRGIMMIEIKIWVKKNDLGRFYQPDGVLGADDGFSRGKM